jgi:hypothetical protein
VRHRFEGLHETALSAGDLPEGLFLVRVERVRYRWHAQKPYYSLQFVVLEPKRYAGASISSRVYCTSKALWKLNWFLRDFNYDVDFLAHDEVDDKHLVGLEGVVKISRIVVHGTPFIKLDGFAPGAQWEELSTSAPSTSGSEVF